MPEQSKLEQQTKSIGILSAFKDSKLSKKEKTLPALSISVIVVSSVLFFNPLIKNISSAKSELDTLKKEYKSVEKKRIFLVSKDDDAERKLLSKRLDYMEKYVPSIKPSLQTLLHISRLSRLRNIEFSGLNLNPGTVKTEVIRDANDGRLQRQTEDDKFTDQLSNFEVQFSIVGKKDNLLDFVSKLNEISPLMKVEFFNTAIVKTADEDTPQLSVDQNTFMQATLRLLVYYKDTPDTLPALAEVDAIILTDEEDAFLTEIEDYLFLDERFIKADDVIIDAPLGKSNPFTDPLEKVTQSSAPSGSSIVVDLNALEAEGVDLDTKPASGSAAAQTVTTGTTGTAAQ